MTRRHRCRLAPVGLLCLVFAASTACSLSNSSKSISNSLSSPFKWSSSSSGGDESAYREDVKRLTVAHVGAGGDLGALRRDLGSLAQQSGISDWEADPPTCWSVGAGLHASGLSEAEAQRFAQRLLGPDSERLAQVARGYGARAR